MKRLVIPIIILLLVVSCQKEVYYNISTSVNPKDAGTVSVFPAGPSVLEGTSVTVTAQPKGEYVFTGWSGNLSGTDNPKTVAVTSVLNITANFALKEYPLSISVEGEGAVSEKVISTKTDYTSGTVVELTAKPADHWLFDHWEGDLNGNTNPVQITLSSAKTVKAVFVKKMYDLSIEIQGEGTVEEAVLQTKATSIQEGTVVELTALPGDHWVFDHWEGDLSGNKNPAQITIASDKKVKAVFVEKMYPLTIEVEGSGAVKEEVISTKSGSYQEGSVIELTASPAEHWVFDHWEGDLAGSQNPSQITISSAKTVKAVFVEKMYPLTVEVQGGGAVKEEVISTKSGSYKEGSVVQLTATPSTYWAFDHWEGDVTGNDNPAIITIASASFVKAVFVEHDPGIVFTETEDISPYEINRRMGMGINLGNQLDAYRDDGRHHIACETAWGSPLCTQIIFDRYAAAGFKSVRIPITWMGTFGTAPDYKIDEERLNRIAEIVGFAEKAGLNVIINMHHDDGPRDMENHPDDFWINPCRAAADPAYNEKVKEQLSALWKQIARRFRDKGDFLLFESFNEPANNFFSAWPSEAEKAAHFAEYKCLSDWNQVFVDAVRSTGGNNSSRWLIAVCAGATERNMDQLTIPKDYVSNNRLMLSIHVYEPAEYAFGFVEEWGHTAQVSNEETLRFDESFFEQEFHRYKETYLDGGIPIIVDEMGCFNRDNERGKAFQLYYLEYLVRAASINGIPTFIWDDGGKPGVKRGEFLFWRDTGEYVDYAEEIIDVIFRATYSKDSDYTLQSIYDRAPFCDTYDREVIIPDNGFRDQLLRHCDLNGDGHITKNETWRVTEINVNTTNISSLQGIEEFENLVVLRCRGREDWVADEYGPGLLTELDVSHNPLLRILEFNNNHITSIDLSHNPELESICCRSNAMQSIDISHNTHLVWFDASVNHLESLDVSANHEVRGIYLSRNNLKEIVVSGLYRLEELSVGLNRLSSMDLTCNYQLKHLYCDANLLSSLDLSFNKDLEFLLCVNNPSLTQVFLSPGQKINNVEKDDYTNFVYRPGIEIKDPAFKKFLISRFDTDGDWGISESEAEAITEIEVCTDDIFSLGGIEYFANLRKLVCMGSYDEEFGPNNYYGKLSELNVSKNKQLEYLSCGYNQLTSLDVSHNPRLRVLRFMNNQIREIDISNNLLLEELYCRYCHLSSLNVVHNPNLRELDCQGTNRLKDIDLSHCPKLSLFNANGVGLESLDVTGNPELSWLGCASSYFKSINLSNNPCLLCFYGDNNSLTELDLTHNPQMNDLFVRNSPDLQYVYLNKGQTIANVYKDTNTQIAYR